MISKRIRTLLKDPSLAIEYAGWIARSIVTGGAPTRLLYGGVKVGGFVNFSEYHMVPLFIDEIDLNFIQRHSFGSGDILDVGANIGIVSLLLAQRFPERQIHAFEPNPSTFQSLCANIGRNHAQNIAANEVAISDTNGFVLFDADPRARGTASIARGHGENVIQLASETLDSFVEAKNIKSIGLLKVDVEGFESLVFSGAMQVLRERRPTAVFFEVCPALTEKRGFDPKGPATLLRSIGYDLFRPVRGGSLQEVSIEDVNDVKLENWVAIPQ